MKTLTIALGLMLAAAGPVGAQESTPETIPMRLPHALELSPMSPMFHIYVLQYAYHTGEHDVLMGGMAYSEIPQKPAEKSQPGWMDIVITPNTYKKEIGTNHSWTVFVGYKRYLWKGLHVEYQLWPGYNAFWSNTEKKYYRGFDLWNEFRAGYTVNFGDSPFYMNIQYLVGFGLVRGNKPSDFGENGDRVFRAPLLFVGWRF